MAGSLMREAGRWERQFCVDMGIPIPTVASSHVESHRLGNGDEGDR